MVAYLGLEIVNYIGVAETERVTGRCRAEAYFCPNGFTGSSAIYETTLGLMEVCCSAYGRGLFVEKEFE
jgi:hypothetical protein